MKVNYESIWYNGKMTDNIPAWVWKVATDYLFNFLDYTKVCEYLKKHHGNKQLKVIFCEIKEIISIPTLIKPKLQVIYLTDNKSSEDGKYYYVKTNTSFIVDNKHYRVEREILIWVSEMFSSVQKSNLKLYIENSNEPILEVE